MPSDKDKNQLSWKFNRSNSTNAGKRYKIRGPHPASRQAKEGTKLVDAIIASGAKTQEEVNEAIAKYLASKQPVKEIVQPQTAVPAQPAPVEPAKKQMSEEERKKYLAELADWENY